MNKEDYLGHIFDIEKKSKMSKLMDKIYMVMKNHSTEYSDFLDPYEIRLAQSILNRFENIDYIITGGYIEAERKSLCIFPDYFYADDIDTKLKFLEISGASSSLLDKKHPDFLGALLNLGITRDKIGDILVFELSTIVVVKEEIADFLLYNLERIGNSKVNLAYIDNILEVPKIDYEELTIFASSLRLDLILSSVHNISRKESKDIIIAERVKVDWEMIDKTSFELEVGNMISTKGYGRFIIFKKEGKSKKDKYILIIRKIV